ncbi:MAG: DUF3570 domain-containing protein [Pseudomonadales bacterium]
MKDFSSDAKTGSSIIDELASATQDLLRPSADTQTGVVSAAGQRSIAKRSLVKGLTATVFAGGTFAAEPGHWDIDTAVLYYNETDRVQAIEPVVSATRQFDGERSLNTKLVVDVLTGASPNGAVASDFPQTYTRPSGKGNFTISNREIPLDDTFKDTRFALSANWKQPLGEKTDGNIGLAFSNEYDYVSASINGGFSYELDSSSTLSAGLSYAADSIDPVGGVPLEKSCMVGASANTSGGGIDCTVSFDATRRGGDDSKDTLDLLLGYTRVVNQTTVAQFNLILSQSDGYHNDPYKVVSVVDSTSGEPLRHLYESRPDSRFKTGLFSRVKTWLFDRDVLDASYRFQSDDWSMDSHTLDLRYRWQFASRQALIPHLRYYTQSETDFYKPFLRADEAVPEYVSADYRQGSFDGITVGLEYAWQPRNSESDVRVALEYYQQSGDQPGNAPGQLANKEIYPDLDAIMLRFNYDFDL